MKTHVLGPVALSCLLLAGAARAQSLDPAATSSGFGAPGQVAIAGDFSLGFTHISDHDISSIVLAPALDYFLVPHLSLGGQLRFTFTGTPGGSTTTLGIGPRVGYDIPLGAMFSLYPRFGFFLDHTSVSPKGGGMSDSYTLFSLFVFAPFLFHPVPHFFIGVGPFLEGDVAGADERRRTFRFGLASTVGGWFDW